MFLAPLPGKCFCTNLVREAKNWWKIEGEKVTFILEAFRQKTQFPTDFQIPVPLIFPACLIYVFVLFQS